MYSVWDSVLLWAFLSLFSSTAVTYTPENIKLQEEKTTRLAGSCVTIQCEHKAQGEMQLLWFKNAKWDNDKNRFYGIIVYSNTEERPQDLDYSGRVEFFNKINDRSDCSLKINDLKMNDNGNYSLRYISANEKYMSSMFNLTVTENVCQVHIEPLNLNKSLKEGDILSLRCATSKDCASYPKWHSFGSSEIFNTKDTEKQWSGLNLTLSWKDDGRTLTCHSPESHADHCLDKSVNLTVQYAPKNTYIKGIHEIKLGLKLNLECFTEAKPPANNYSWYYKPGHEKYFLMLSHIGQKYSIDKVAVNNAGVYKCSAQNVIGKGGNSSEINILVLYPPRKPKLTLQDVKENEPYSITCTVESSPPSELTLSQVSLTNPKKYRNVTMTASSNILNFTGKASVQDAGTYTCVAKNSEGNDSSNGQLKVFYAPKNVTVSAYPGNELKEGSELKLSCKADSVPEVSAYTWKKSFGRHSVIVGHGQTITLRLKSSDSDHYFCISGNEIGSAESPAVYIRVKYRPHITIIHNMTSLSLLENAVPVHLICSVQSDPPVFLFAWYKLEENTTVLSTNQNFTVQPQYPGTYYCDASNEVGKSTSEPVEINLYHFIIKQLVLFFISLLVILFLIGVIFLLQRILLRKRCLGTNEAAQRSFIFSTPPLSSNLLSSESCDNTRENLVMEGSSETSCFRDNRSGTADYSYPLANRPTQAGRPDYNMQTTYDLLMLPSTLKHHNQEDLTMTTLNFVQFIDSNNPDKSVPNHDSCGTGYAKIFKKERMAKEEPCANEDYENVSGVCTTKQPFSNRNWDSDSSESEEEVKYTKVLFTATSQHNRQREVYSSDEEDKTEYSQVKI